METRSQFFKETLKLIVIVAVIALPIRFFIVEPYTVFGPSMHPTFQTGQYLFVDKLSYRISEPSRGDVIVLQYPLNPDDSYIKRIVGLPGERIHIDKGVVTIANTEHPEGFVLSEPYISALHQSRETASTTLRDDEYFVMGDNRKESSDSRIWGPLPAHNIVGTPLIRLWPLDAIAYRPGSISHFASTTTH